MTTSPTHQITLTTFTYGGESLGRLPDQRAVFVPYALPNETVRICLVEEKRGYARAELVEVLEPSPERIEPRCSHFAQCGGCHYQHIPYEVQLQAKTDILRDQLKRIGKLEHPTIRPIIPSPHPWNYRNHVQFHLTPDGKLGFQSPRSHEVIPIGECHLLQTPLNETWPLLDIESIPGLDRVGLRLGVGDDIMLTLESSDPNPVELSVDLPLSVVHLGPGGCLVLAGDDHTVIEVGGRPFRVSAGSFFQVNTPMAEAMVQHLLDNLSLTGETSVIDAYCGVGLFSAFLAPRVQQLIGIESSSSACDDFVVNLDEFDNVELYEAPVEDVLPHLDLDSVPEILVADPPRGGLGRRTLDGILTLGPEVIAYISCDPATLSRDARRLTEGGYQLRQITPFDLFPQTYHIESISFWDKH
ncbi:MAG: class I SAM-dependent RNA methyltransferase [Chloroflexi bacterium]|nr:class I SAM-dependent RNA methyltransferase [Chloroflexota bacterium]